MSDNISKESGELSDEGEVILDQNVAPAIKATVRS